MRLAEYVCYANSATDASHVYALCRRARASPLSGPQALSCFCGRLADALAALPPQEGPGLLEALLTRPAAPARRSRAATLRPSDVQALSDLTSSQNWRLSEGMTQALRDCGTSLTPSSAHVPGAGAPGLGAEARCVKGTASLAPFEALGAGPAAAGCGKHAGSPLTGAAPQGGLDVGAQENASPVHQNLLR